MVEVRQVQPCSRSAKLIECGGLKWRGVRETKEAREGHAADKADRWPSEMGRVNIADSITMICKNPDFPPSCHHPPVRGETRVFHSRMRLQGSVLVETNPKKHLLCLTAT